MSIDQFFTMDFNDPTTPGTTSGPQLQIASDSLDTTGMNYSQMFSHYLAPDVGKISASSPLPSPSLLDSFSSDFILESSTAIDPADVYNRSTQSIPASPFTYNHLGSPIESYSPSSDHSTSTGFDFIDTSNDLIMSYESEGGASIESTGRPWAIDPRFAEFSQDRAEDGIKAESEDGIAQSSRSTPRIVVKPASLRRASVPVIEEEDEEEEDRIIKDEEMDSDGETYNSIPLPSLSKSAPPAPVVLLKKKRTPKLAKTSVDKFATAELHITSSRSHLAPVPDWTDKPDPDAYKALGSKEKRQLRNKISARNFRHRRKENFNSLEEGITTRDTVIVELREEVAVLRQDNSALKQEVDSMKKQWAEMMAKMTNLSVSSLTSNVPGLGLAATPTAPSSIKSLPARRLTSLPPLLLASLPPLPPLPFASAASNDDWPLASPPIASGSGSRTRAVVKIAKDVAPGSKRATGSWTTSMGTGRYMPVHTMLLPEFNGLYPKSLDPLSPSYRSDSLTRSTLPDFSSLSDKAPLHANLASDLLAFQSPRTSEQQTIDQMHGFVAKLVLQTLMNRLAGSFIESFTSLNPTQVVDIISGRASVVVVSNSIVDKECGVDSAATLLERLRLPSSEQSNSVWCRLADGRPRTPNPQ